MKVRVLLAATLGLASSLKAATYRITDLGTLGGDSYGTAINASGQVAGRSGISSTLSDVHAFRYTGGNPVDLGTLGGPNSYATGIAADGTIVGGGTTTGETATRGFIAVPNVAMADLGTLGGTGSAALGINSSLAVVGHSQIAGNAYTHAFLYAPAGGMTDLGTLAGTNFNSRAYAINDKGQIVGESQVASGATHAFLRANGVMSDLGTLGGINSYARAISSNGYIAGFSETASFTTRAFLYDRTTMIDLGSLGGTTSVANGVNSSGDVVGSSYLSDNSTLRAFLYSGGTLRNLNDLLENNSGWTLVDALAINDAGQITGYGVLNGQTRAFLLSKVTPSSLPPRVYVNGSKSLRTANPKIRIEGSSGGDVVSVKYRVNSKGPWRKVRGQLSGWKVTVPLEPGRNLVQFVAYGSSGKKSKPAKVKIFRAEA